MFIGGKTLTKRQRVSLGAHHGASREVRDANEVQLGQRVWLLKQLLVHGQHLGGHLQGVLQKASAAPAASHLPWAQQHANAQQDMGMGLSRQLVIAATAGSPLPQQARPVVENTKSCV